MAQRVQRAAPLRDDGLLEEVKQREVEQGGGDDRLEDSGLHGVAPVAHAVDEGWEHPRKQPGVDRLIVRERDEVRKGRVEKQSPGVDLEAVVDGLRSSLLLQLLGREVAEEATERGGYGRRLDGVRFGPLRHVEALCREAAGDALEDHETTQPAHHHSTAPRCSHLDHAQPTRHRER